LEGEARIGGQEHFYLETSGCVVTPGEDDEMHITGTTQNPNKTQEYVARVLGLGAHKVVVTTKRLGGGFGGKETRTMHLIAAAAIAARKINGPECRSIPRSTLVKSKVHSCKDADCSHWRNWFGGTRLIHG
jgi:xanthine dehydrogenase/oxidase